MIKSLTPIRFALCMMIFAHHAYGYAGGGAAAVAAFFILSGFCLTIGYKNRIVSGDFDAFSFFKKRLAKFYSIHWITLIAQIFVAFGLGTLALKKRTVIANFFLLQSWIPEQSYYFSYNAIAWYLSTALLAYLCFPMLTLFFHKINRTSRIVTLGGILVAHGVIAYAMPTAHYHAMLYINPCARLIDFIIGMFLADFFMSHDWSNATRYNGLIDAGIIISFFALNIISIYTPNDYRPIAAIYWFPAAALILLTCTADKTSSLLSKCMSWNFTQKSTQCSFSLMMWSIIGINLLRELNIANGLWGGAIIFFGVYIVAQISYYLIENKLTTWIVNKVK